MEKETEEKGERGINLTESYSLRSHQGAGVGVGGAGGNRGRRDGGIQIREKSKKGF